MRGKLYGIGTGPGDPELLTLKAIHTMEKCDVIAVPGGSGGGDKTAFGIVEPYIKGKPLLECLFSMSACESVRKEHRTKAADDVCSVLETGKTVGLITLGDPTIYSTYMYVHKIVAERGFETEIIPGIPSFIAAAQALNDSLCEGNELLHIIPGSQQSAEEIDSLLSLPGNKVIMKSGKNLAAVLEVAEKRGLSDKTKIVERCGMEGEQIFENIAEFKKAGTASYFSIAIIRGE